MIMNYEYSLIILIAFVLDLILGDPHWLLHPVRLIGRLIGFLEDNLRKTKIPLKIAGVLLVACVIVSVLSLSFILIKFAYGLNYYSGLLLSSVLVYFAIAPKNLYDESMKIYSSLKKGDMESARRNLSMIVGRDINELGEREIVRASVETVAENSVDAIISPLFYAMIGGAPLAIVYRAINTMDSMVGYKNKRYIDFGWAAARLDDVVNYIPARLSAILIPLSSLIYGKDWLNSFKIAFRDGKKNPSPNSGIPEAAVAGALGIRLGGLNYYKGVPSDKPFIGDCSSELSTKHIKETNILIFISSILFILICITISL
jgi:adenosylcobinamide-phosphate synthase